MECINSELCLIKDLLSKNLPYSVSTYGKLIRSKIGLLLLKANDIPVTNNHILFLTAIELTHTASLLHDDIIDNESTRRNSKTIYKQKGSKVSLLYGNIVLSNALNLLLLIENDAIIKLFNKTVIDMCKGELLQQEQLFQIPTEKEYIKRCQLKTAALFCLIAKGISMLSNELSSNSYRFCENFGIGFQVKNDLDNILSDKTDVLNGIYTAPVIYSNGTDIQDSALEKTKALIDNYIENCLTELEKIKESDYKKELIGVVECLRK